MGGSESLAWQYAQLLKDSFQVEVLTTTTTDAVSWKNELPEGEDKLDGVLIRRFNVELGRTPYWTALHERMLRDFAVSSEKLKSWPLALQEEFIKLSKKKSDILVIDVSKLDFKKEEDLSHVTNIINLKL